MEALTLPRSQELDPSIAAILGGTAGGQPKIAKLLQFEYAFSSVFMCYRDETGAYTTRHSLDSSYPKLAAWIDGDDGHHGDKYRIALGPSGQFFAMSNRGYRWHGVPEQFHDEMQTMMAGDDEGPGGWRAGWKPSGAAFGVHNSFLVFCEGGEHVILSRNLGQHYPDLVKRLQQRFAAPRTTAGVYEYIAINPYAPNEFLVVWVDGTLSWKLPPSFSAFTGAMEEWLDHCNAQKPAAVDVDVDSLVERMRCRSPSISSSSIDSRTTLVSDAYSASSSRTSTPCAQPMRGFYPSTTPRPQYYPSPSAYSYQYPYSPNSVYPSSPMPYYSLFSAPQDSSVMDMLRFFQSMQQVTSHVTSSMGSGLFGNGGGFVDPTMGMSSVTMFGGSPFAGGGTSLWGMDPTGGLLNPWSAMGSFGLDPGTLAMSTGCTVM